MADRTRAQKIADKTTDDIYPGPNKASADKEIAEYAKDLELIESYDDDAMRAKTFNTRETLKTKGQNRGRSKGFSKDPKLTQRESAAVAAAAEAALRKANKTGGGRGDGTAELMELHTGGRNKERIKNELIDSFLDASKKVRSKAKGGTVRDFNNGGAVMSGRGPKFKGIT